MSVKSMDQKWIKNRKAKIKNCLVIRCGVEGVGVLKLPLHVGPGSAMSQQFFKFSDFDVFQDCFLRQYHMPEVS